jgi:hypothetical protein
MTMSHVSRLTAGSLVMTEPPRHPERATALAPSAPVAVEKILLLPHRTVREVR